MADAAMKRFQDRDSWNKPSGITNIVVYLLQIDVDPDALLDITGRFGQKELDFVEQSARFYAEHILLGFKLDKIYPQLLTSKDQGASPNPPPRWP